ncbi:MAG: hypothetical protein P8M71_08445 [Pseudomonadales bacterium]|nr:hypothetical protein [Pseudomonadales bacterium]
MKIIPTTQQGVRLFLLALCGCFLFACQSTQLNNTLYPFYLNNEKIASSPVNKVAVAHVNFDAPSKKYLRHEQGKIDNYVKKQLINSGYTIASNALFQQAWRKAIRQYGQPYDNYTSQINQRAFIRVMFSVLQEIKNNSDIDAIVFTDLIERQVSFGIGSSRTARWDGVSRKPKIKGAGAGVSQGFDWMQTVPAVSILLTIYHVDGQRLFQSAGGIEITRMIDPHRGNGRFVRRENIFSSPSHIRKGVALALHPFAVMDDYPKLPEQ